MNAPRCVAGPTCRIPKDVRGTYACPHCRRIWIRRDDGHGPYWYWNGKTPA